MRNKFIKYIKFFIGWPLSVLALFFVFKIFSDKSGFVFSNLKQLNIQVLLYGIFCYFAFFILRCVLWQKILQHIGYGFKLKDVSSLWMTSELKRYIPGNFWSFLKRAYLFSGIGVEKKHIAQSFLIEIEAFLIGTFVISLLSVSFVVYNILSNNSGNQLIVNLLIASTILLTLIFLFGSIIIKNIKIRQIIFLKNILPDSSAHNNLLLLLISVSYMFLYGLGTYFVVSSVVFLSPLYILTFIGFFVFSLLVGYLSFITPMGLGVREGITTLGLSKFISLTQAGFASIFARIVLILSELIFIAFVFFWAKIKNNYFSKIENFINKYVYEIVLLISIGIYTLYFTLISFLRYDNFYTGRFDLGNMDQTVWNTLHGRIFQMTDPNGTNIISRLSFHADFILILLSPFYIIWSNPKMLLLIQSLTLAFGGLFIYLISQKILKNKNLSLVLSFTFLLNPSVEHANLFDFHAVTLGTTFLLATFYFLMQKKYFWFILFAVLSALTKEEVWIIIALFGLYITFEFLSKSIFNQKVLLQKVIKSGDFIKHALLGSSIFIISAIMFYYLIWYAIPSASGSKHFALSYYSDFGDSPGNIIKNIFLFPGKTIKTILQNGRMDYLYRLFIPVGFLPLFYPFLLVFALPDLLINLLSNNTQLHQIYFQYTSTITPFLFIATIYAIRIINKRFNIPITFFSLYLILSSLYSAYSFGPLPGAKNANIDVFTKPMSDKQVVDDFLSKVPQKYSIASTNNIGSHISHRQKIFTIPVGIDKADIVIFLLNDPFAQPSLKAQKETAQKLKSDKNYIEVFKHNDFIVFEKRNLYIGFKPRKNPASSKTGSKLFPLSIESLQHRDFVGGKVKIEKSFHENQKFSSYIISYFSDGLKLYALMNIPKTPKPANGYPVVILNHGYINPQNYSIINSYKYIADYFASHGFLVLKPDYRGHANSEIDNKALMRFAYPIDIMNLVSSIDKIKDADKDKIYLWGHSMGGEITLKVLEIAGKDREFQKQIKKAVVVAPVTDTVKWFSLSHLSSLEETSKPYQQTFHILGTPEKNQAVWQTLSPLTYISDINIPVLIQHGTNDKTVPYEWSIELYDDLISLNKRAKLNLYTNDDHNLSTSINSALEDSIEFFNSN